MSLIQDALKRQQEESESGRVPLQAAPVRPPAAPEAQLPRAGDAGAVAPTLREVGADRPAPSVPDVMPVPSRPDPGALPADPAKPGKSGKSWKLIAGIIIFCILIVWGGGLVALFVMKQSVERTRDTLISGLTTGRMAVNNKAFAPVAAMPKPAVIPPSASGPWLSPAAAAAPAFAEKEEDVDEDMALSSVKEQELLVTAPPPPPLVWPRLKLTAIFSNIGSGQAGARLNNRLILLGDQIEGVALVEIRRDSVMLKYGAEIRFLKMGATLN